MSSTEDSTSSMKIPIVDFSSWNHPHDDYGRMHVARELVDACQKIGFVYIVNHSLPESLLDEAFEWSRRFFDLPQAEKNKAPHPEGWAVHRGYSWPGLEKVSQIISTEDNDVDEHRKIQREVIDAKEVYDIGSEEDANQPNQWIPEETLPGFRDFMSRFYWECFRVAEEILRALAVGLHLEEEDYLTRKHSGHNNQLRLLHYLSVPAGELEKGRVARCPAHTDWSSITMLFQDGCGGLEVEDVSQPGIFFPADPIKNAIVLNIGDLLQMWSNDRLRSTNHRVGLPPLSDRFEGPNRMTRERFSIPYFLAPDPDSVISCIPTCVSEEEPAKYKPITQANYNKMRMEMMY